jgi:hypothetical protein
MPVCDPDRAAAFVASLDAAPWFAALGAPVADPSVPRIASWDEWPGPESAAGEIVALSLQHQAWHDALLEAHPACQAALNELWDEVQRRVMAAAAGKVPYEAGADAWHPPTMAVWQGVWTAGLVAWHMACDAPIPSDLARQWAWYARGHWPCGYASLTPEGDPGPLLVY